MKFLSFLSGSVLLLLCLCQVSLAQDWPDLGRYRAANEKVGAPAPNENRVVFMGNSITDHWIQTDPEFFKKNPYLDRGISGQTTPQMLIRFRPDVIQLDPKAVLILAGTNDIAGNTGPSTLKMIEDNLASMAQLAKANNIKVVLCSVLPASQYPWRKSVKNVAEKIKKLNQWIEKYAHENNEIYLNYYPHLVNDKGGMLSKYSKDGVHPNLAGYRVMEPMAVKAIHEALRQ
ncbi:MAG TPA: SGNH/GDSL hydrolase family protein [Balneolales bacterium]|nr:SGNH/GDSL hydrolase family protein [Balneolales bacterium]